MILTSIERSPGDHLSRSKSLKWSDMTDPNQLLRAVHGNIAPPIETTQLALEQLLLLHRGHCVTSLRVCPLPPKLHQTDHTPVARPHNPPRCPFQGYSAWAMVIGLTMLNLTSSTTADKDGSPIHPGCNWLVSNCSYSYLWRGQKSTRVLGVLPGSYCDIPILKVYIMHPPHICTGFPYIVSFLLPL